MKKPINVSPLSNSSSPFEAQFSYDENGKVKASINNQSVIYKSFNLKDIMIAESFVDQETKTLIESKEKTLDRHIIKKLSDEIEVYPNTVMYIEIDISSNLNILKAEIKVGPADAANKVDTTTPPWDQYPELIGFNPKLEYDKDGTLKNSNITRFQNKAYVPIGYFTPNLSLTGKNINFVIAGKTISQNFVQVLKDNLIIQTFNYDGIPVAYPIPFFGGTYLYFKPPPPAKTK